MDCALCEAKQNPVSPFWHWNGPGRSHCNFCHADWRVAAAAMHCIGCHRTFNTPGTCDAHQPYGPGRCLDPVDVGCVAKPNQWGTEIWTRLVES